MSRVYLDYNATAPLLPAARDAMLAAMEVVGNPSSVHAEGRAAKGLMEVARGQIAQAFGAGEADIVFTSGASEAAALAMAGRGFAGAGVEHEAVLGWVERTLSVDAQGIIQSESPAQETIQLANSETGVVQDLPKGLALSDCTQAFGKLPLSFEWLGCDMALISAHKLGGPKGIGALVMRRGYDVTAQIKGGGQEMGWRSGTENLIGIAGFGAAAAYMAEQLSQGAWARVEKLRDQLEERLVSTAQRTISVTAPKRLPNTLCLITPGWKGETQVMQMDLAGFAISAGSACSSGKVKASKVLSAMGYDELHAASAIRVSLGLETTQEDVNRFAQSWLSAYERWETRAA